MNNKQQKLITKYVEKFNNLYFEDVKPSIGSIIGASRLISELIADNVAIPEDMYLTPDGNIILENQNLDGSIERIEIIDEHNATYMITYSCHPAVFKRIKYCGIFIGWKYE